MKRKAYIFVVGVFAAGAGVFLSVHESRSDGIKAKTVETSPPPALIARAKGFATNDLTLEQTTDHIIAHLNLDFEANILPLSLEGEELGSTRSYVVGDFPSAAPKPDDPLARLVARALLAGHDTARIHYDISSAALAGELTVPASLVTSDGRIDTQLLLDRTLTQAAIHLTQ